MPEISVIVPIYKVEQLLDKCVRSILCQTFTDFELILVDDGSPDRCGEMCDEYAKEDSRIKVIHKKNGGLSDARNAGIDIAAGEYLSFVDSDDYVSPDFLESMLSAIKKHKCKMSVCSVIEFHEDGKEKSLYAPVNEEKVVSGDDMYATIYQPMAQNKMYHKSIFSELRYPYGRLFEDAFIYHYILNQIDRLVYTGKMSYHYFVRSDSIMHKPYRLKNTDIVDAAYDRAVFLDSHGPHAYADDAYLAIYNRLAGAYTQLDLKDDEVKSRLNELHKLYISVYPRMIKDEHYSFKQKIRLWMLRYFPRIHVIIYPMYTR